MNELTKAQAFDALCDLAQKAGMTAEEYLIFLANDEKDSVTGEKSKEEISKEKPLRDEKSESIGKIRESRENDEINGDIARFKSLFPDVAAGDIPQSVWDEVQNGISLTHAYALFKIINESEKAKAQSFNDENLRRSAPVSSEGEDNSPISSEQVEKMSPKAVLKNYSRILSSIKNWRL